MAAVAKRMAAAETARSAEYLAAEQRWRGYLAARNALQGRITDLKRQLTAADRAWQANRIRDGLDRVEGDLAELAGNLGAERQLWDHARNLEAEAVARALQPRHREAVKAIGKALEVLSAAIGAERAARDAFASAGIPETSESLLLPDCSTALMVGSLDDYGSIASQWNRRMLGLGVLA
jgi:hypothetical protein